MNSPQENILRANWNAPCSIKTLITQTNSFSTEQQSSEFGFNIGAYVEDDFRKVQERRSILERRACLPAQPAWLKQVRGSAVVCLDDEYLGTEQEADASFSFEKNRVCVVTSADCLPVFLSDTKGNFVAAIHSGWQGLYENIIHNSIKKIRKKAQANEIDLAELIAYIAPSISRYSYQVDEEFVRRFVDINESYQRAFSRDKEPEKYLADLKLIAKLQLESEGVKNIVDSGICTYLSKDFYSHRQATHQGKKSTGRFASMIWKQD